MTSEELQERRPVWIALANLFLDADLRRWYALVAGELAQSPYSIELLETILNDEVAPALWGQSGGPTGFDDRVADTIEHRLKLKRKLPPMEVPEADWRNVVHLIEHLRRYTRADWPSRIRAWGILSRLFLDRDPILPALDLPKDALGRMWRDEMWPAYGGAVDSSHAASATRYPSQQEIEQAWTDYQP